MCSTTDFIAMNRFKRARKTEKVEEWQLFSYLFHGDGGLHKNWPLTPAELKQRRHLSCYVVKKEQINC